MKRREPFYKKSHRAWYVQLDGRQVRLAADEAAAWDRYHELMAAARRAEKFVTPGVPTPIALGALLDQFLAAAFRDRSAATKEWYADKLVPFVAHVGDTFPAPELKPMHVERWAAAHPDWAAGTVRNQWRAVQRLYRWGHRAGLVPELTLLHYEKPRGGRREVVIAPEQYARLLTFVRNDEFRALLTVAWETGARPQELLAARVRHFDLRNERLVFPPRESKDRGHPRVVYLTGAALDLIRPPAGADPEAHLLRNSEGRPWTTDAAQCAFVALHKRMRAAEVECPKYCLYHFRHSWLDRMLKKGVDALTCAILMGHRDPSMVAKTYQHLSQSPAYLREALTRAAG